MSFPTTRMRRLRRDPRLRALVAETALDASKWIMPLFVRPGSGERREIGAMPGNYQLSPDETVKEARKLQDAGVGGIILFGIPETKDARGSEGYADDGIIPTAVRALKESTPGILILTDVCLCEYTDHGHCGLIEGDDVANDPTLELLARQALSHARAGADIVAPSDMMDGRVGAIRTALDEAGFASTPILSYAAKYASAFYGPFREAAESAPRFGPELGFVEGSATGRLDSRPVVPLEVSPNSIVAFDVDRDGTKDLLALSSSAVHLVRGDGAGGFRDPVAQEFPGRALQDLEVLDLEGDGRQELAFTDLASGSVVLAWLDDGGTVASTEEVAVSDLPMRLVAGDFDGDGRADIVTRTESARTTN